MSEPVHHAYMSSPLGLVMIRGNSDCVHYIRIHEENEPQRDSFPLPEALAIAVVQLREYFAGKRRVFSFPFCAQGTTFQRNVWSALMDIPYGETRSYLDIAHNIAHPKGARAVGTANAKNPLWIVIPCHRVIASNGSLSGYAGGIWRKKWLLTHERRMKKN